jgi:hypothetical protein
MKTATLMRSSGPILKKSPVSAAEAGRRGAMS